MRIHGYVVLHRYNPQDKQSKGNRQQAQAHTGTGTGRTGTGAGTGRGESWKIARVGDACASSRGMNVYHSCIVADKTKVIEL